MILEIQLSSEESNWIVKRRVEFKCQTRGAFHVSHESDLETYFIDNCAQNEYGYERDLVETNEPKMPLIIGTTRKLNLNFQA